MSTELNANSNQTDYDTPNRVPLHLRMSDDERILWARANYGIFEDIARRHLVNAKPVSAPYVSNIFYGLTKLRTPLSRRISRSLDRAIVKSQNRNLVGEQN